MDNKLIRCAQITIDCLPNDPTSVKESGPLYLGFDFFVKDSETFKMKGLIKSTLKSYQVPVASIYLSKIFDIPESQINTPEEIVEEIKDKATYFHSKSKEKNKTYEKK